MFLLQYAGSLWLYWAVFPCQTLQITFDLTTHVRTIGQMLCPNICDDALRHGFNRLPCTSLRLVVGWFSEIVLIEWFVAAPSWQAVIVSRTDKIEISDGYVPILGTQ